MTNGPQAEESLGPVHVIDGGDDAFPTRLSEIADPPARLWVIGSLPHPPVVAVVGTRHPSDTGIEAAIRVVASLAGRRVGIVAGLSPGIDATAHEAALTLDLPTWAFVGGGPDLVDSSADRALAARIIGAGGGVIAEVPDGTPDSVVGRRRRDRLQSGSSALTVVVQSDRESGTRHTAQFALAQSRLLGVVRPPASEADSPMWALNRELLPRADLVIDSETPGNVFDTVLL